MWLIILAACVALRAAIPLAVLIAHGRGLPGLPVYTYNPRPGDAYGYYSAVRALLATWREPATLAAAVVLLALAVLIVRALLKRGHSAWAVVAGAIALGALGAVLADRMSSSGAPTIGWPLVWSVPLLPYRAVGFPLDPNIAFGVGLTLTLLANSVTVVATAILARRVTGRAEVGLLAAAAYSVWPLLTGQLTGHRAWENGTWLVDTGLHLYSEPVSTALVVTALALIAVRAPSELALGLAGSLLSLASVVRLSNAVIAAVVLGLALLRFRARGSLTLAVGLASFLPVALAYWSKGYTHLPASAGGLPSTPFALRYAHLAWTHSLLWRPPVLILLLPLAVVGTLAVRPAWWRWLLWLVTLATAAFYSVYCVTDIHPRFLYVVFPFVLVLWAAGLMCVLDVIVRRDPTPG